MNKKEFITAVSQKSGLTQKDVESALSAAADVITETLVSGDSIRVVGFGSLYVVSTAAHTTRDPRTGSEVNVPAHYRVRFKAGKTLRSAVDQKAD